jgi:hypothetical protein
MSDESKCEKKIKKERNGERLEEKTEKRKIPFNAHLPKAKKLNINDNKTENNEESHKILFTEVVKFV